MIRPLMFSIFKARFIRLLAICFGAMGIMSAHAAGPAQNTPLEGPSPIIKDGFESVCPTPLPGIPDVPVTNAGGTPVALSGGELLDADWELSVVEFYSDEAFNDLLSDVSWSSNGGTYGASRTRVGGGWGFNVRLDLMFEAMSLTGPVEFGFETIYEAAGVATTMIPVEPSLVVETSCSPLWGGATELPYQVTSTPDELTIRITMTRDAFLAEAPPELLAILSMALVGDIPIVLRFEL